MPTVCNNVPRHLVYAYDVPQKVLESEFDYHLDMPENERPIDGYFKYKGEWYHLDQFMRFDRMSKWDGYLSDTAFSAIVIKLVDDCESIIVGRIWE